MITAQYKNYTASIEYSAEDECYVGEVIGMNHHTIVFGGDTIEKVHSAFQEMIDYYLDDCKNTATEPEVPTVISVLFPTDLYIEASEKAERKGLTVRKLITEALIAIS